MDPPNIKMVTLCSLAETIQPNESDKTVDLKFAYTKTHQTNT